MAFDKRTGSELWRMDRQGERSSWGTPFVWKNKARTEIVCIGQRVRSYDPATGKLLWELGGNGGQCLEVARDLFGIVAIRDSKDPDGPKLIVSSGEWRAFINGVQQGEFGLG